MILAFLGFFLDFVFLVDFFCFCLFLFVLQYLCFLVFCGFGCLVVCIVWVA